MNELQNSDRVGVFGSLPSAHAFFLLALMLPALLLPAFAHAEASGDNWLKEQLRQSTLAVRQLQDENGALQVQLAAAQKAAAKVDEGKAARVEVEKVRTGMAAELAGVRVELDAAIAQVALLKQQLLDANEKLAAAAASERNLSDIAARTTACEKDNRELVAIADELLQQFRDMSVWKALWQAEPVTGIGRVQREAIAEKYRGRIIDAATRISTKPDSSERQ